MENHFSLRRSGSQLLVAVLSLLLTPLGADAITASPVRLSWSSAADPSVRGYAIYYGLASSSSLTRIDVGSNLSVTITNLTAGLAYRIYAVSYNSLGAESLPSNALTYTPPNPTSASPKLQLTRMANGQVQLSYKASPGTICGVQFASVPNPTSWQTLANITADGVSNVIANDLSARLVPQRFYRVALSAQPLTSEITTAVMPGGALRLSWTAPPLSTNRVVFAPYVTSTIWPTLATVVADAEGRATAIDPNGSAVGQRFYKVILP